MQSKLVLAIVLCVGAVGAVGFGAAPALAADDCTTCHTTPPTGAAPAPHTPYVAGAANCTVCHRGMTVPHPKLVEPKLSVEARLPNGPYLKGEPVILLSGQLTRPSGRGVNRVAVYLQQRALGETTFVTVSKVTTFRIAYLKLGGGHVYVDGNFVGRVTSPIWGATYRAVSRGVAAAGRPVVKPGSVEALLKPDIQARLTGLDAKGHLKLGRSVVLHCRVLPGELAAGETVALALVKGWRHDNKKVMMTAQATISRTGRFSWEVTPAVAGRWYSINFTVPATAAHLEGWGATNNFRAMP